MPSCSRRPWTAGSWTIGVTLRFDTPHFAETKTELETLVGKTNWEMGTNSGSIPI